MNFIPSRLRFLERERKKKKLKSGENIGSSDYKNFNMHDSFFSFDSMKRNDPNRDINEAMVSR